MWLLLFIQFILHLNLPTTTSTKAVLEEALHHVPDTIPPFWTVTAADTLISEHSAWAGRVYADTHGRFVQVDLRVYDSVSYPSAARQYLGMFEEQKADTTPWNYRKYVGHHELSAFLSSRLKIRINAVSIHPLSMLAPFRKAIPLQQLKTL